MTGTRVVLVEDNQVFREALVLLLGMQEDIEVVGTVANGAAAEAVVRDLQPDVVLLDYRLPGMNGLEVTRAIHSALPEVRVVCLTASISTREIDELYAAGAVACLTKDEELDEIIAAVRGTAR